MLNSGLNTKLKFLVKKIYIRKKSRELLFGKQRGSASMRAKMKKSERNEFMSNYFKLKVHDFIRQLKREEQ